MCDLIRTKVMLVDIDTYIYSKSFIDYIHFMVCSISGEW